MKQAYVFDPETGDLLHDYLISPESDGTYPAEDELDSMTYTVPADGFMRPVWNGAGWGEGEDPAVQVRETARDQEILVDSEARGLFAGDEDTLSRVMDMLYSLDYRDKTGQLPEAAGDTAQLAELFQNRAILKHNLARYEYDPSRTVEEQIQEIRAMSLKGQQRAGG